ncbi:cation-translocating P-type ATPase [Haladaptatus sp.]|uniref:cation-translocating P-type ATPase n=1 Tax=Haladaptatus sp. TaxID=1973141 RepID=UPI003C4E5E17
MKRTSYADSEFRTTFVEYYMQREPSFWSESVDGLFAELDTTRAGLSTETARQRLEAYGYNRFQRKERLSVVRLFARQFKSAIVLLLLFAAVLSFLLGEKTETWIIFAIVLLSGLLGFWQEYSATNAVEELLSLVEIEAEVVRDGEPSAVKIDEVVPGDITHLNAGDTIPGDCRLLEAESLHVNEAVLTGETFPVEKTPGTVSPTAPIADRTNSLFMGTHVVSGEATAVVVRTGEETELGQISERLQYRPPETDFERGIRHFGHLLLEVTLLLVLAIFAINVYFQRPIFDSFLFALALAVGLTPQLLPAIITINLASGARDMATENVIVKQPSSIENFGSMDVFCADKTGTLTEGTIRVHSAIDIDGNESERTFLHAYLNSSYESGFENPIDDAVREADDIDTTPYRKLGEVPYDFTRKRLSVLLADRDESRLITKGRSKTSSTSVRRRKRHPGTSFLFPKPSRRFGKGSKRRARRGFECSASQHEPGRRNGRSPGRTRRR